MKKLDYINNEIKSIKEEKEEIKKVFDKKELLSFLAFTSTGAVAFCTLPFSLPISLGFASICAGAICYKYKCGKKHEIENNKLNQEIKHLNKIASEEPLQEKRLYDKARSKVIAISKSQIEEEKLYNNAHDVTDIMYVITAIGAVSTMINPWTVWLPIVGVCSSILSGNQEIRSFKRKEVLDNRINNLIRDLDVNEIIENETRKEETVKVINNVYSNEYVKENHKNKVYTKSRN